MSRDRTAFLFLNLGHAYDHLFMLLYPTVVLALEVELQRPYGELLLLATPGFVAFGVGSLPSGWLGDRWSRNGMMGVFFFGLGGASILTGLARTPVEIMLGLTLIGLFGSIYHPVGIAMVVPGRDKVGKALGINGVFGNMGVALAALTAGVLTELISWRAAFILPGLVAVATGFAFLAFVRSAPTGTPAAKPAPKAPIPRNDQVRAFAVLAIATLCGGVVFHVTTISLPKIFDERLTGLATGTIGVGAVVSAVYATAAFAQIGVGHLIDRHALRPVFVLVAALQVPLMLLAAGLHDLPMLAVSLGMMLLVFGEIPIHDALVARYTTEAWRSRVFAVKYVLSFGVSAVSVPLVAFLYGLTGGFGWLLVVLAAMAAIIAASAFLLPSERRAAPALTPASGGLSTG